MVALSWFPDTAYEYAVMLEDYHQRPASEMRRAYFEAVAEQNLVDYYTASSEPIPGPTEDWKPVSVLLFRSIFELLLDHLIWKVVWVQLLPSADAPRYADFLLDRFRGASERTQRLYPFVTGSPWQHDLDRLQFSRVGLVIVEAAKVRNSFLHLNPFAGHHEEGVADRVRASVPDLFKMFATLANEYYHPRVVALRRIQNVGHDA